MIINVVVSKGSKGVGAKVGTEVGAYDGVDIVDATNVGMRTVGEVILVWRMGTAGACAKAKLVGTQDGHGCLPSRYRR